MGNLYHTKSHGSYGSFSQCKTCSTVRVPLNVTHNVEKFVCVASAQQGVSGFQAYPASVVGLEPLTKGACRSQSGFAFHSATKAPIDGKGYIRLLYYSAGPILLKESKTISKRM
ncbi:hypothetical protein PoB_007226100 [Plakobranchus ocellatus]|uniref:Uncharacterized protein n=1 Tax=Plakobranchus ocellatus TaxID=259542 RepID=A0AAV4DNQ2_9GAST|nr:hypothetical protein PoB_007226100 [Plakobranchus ocellatus]